MLTRRQLLAVAGGGVVTASLGALAGCGSGSDDNALAPLTGVPPRRHAYGSGPEQHGDLYLPTTNRRPGTVVVVHGGFWLAEYTSDLGAPLASDLARRGHTVWNLEYRSLGSGGGWPNTLLDMASGVDYLATMKASGLDLDLSQVLVLGHSAGGQLAVWAAGRSRLPAGAPGGTPKVTVTAAVSQAGLLDLVGADRGDVGEGAVRDFLGGHADQVPQRYADASPLARVPLPAPVRCVHSRADQNVPYSQSTAYVEAARRAGADAELVTVEGSHFDLIDVTSPVWARIVTVVETLLG